MNSYEENKNGPTASMPMTGWSASAVSIGRITLTNVHVHSTEGAFNFNNTLRLALDKTARNRNGGQSRYAEPLPASAPTRLLSIESEDFMCDMERRGLRPTTLMTQRHSFRLLLLAAGDIPVSEINVGDVREFWDVLRWFPQRASWRSEFKGMSDAEILEAGKTSNRPAPSRSTFNAHKNNLAIFFNRLLKMRAIAHSPLEAFGNMKDELLDTDTRRGFTESELGELFSEETFLPWARTYPHRWWSPMLALYTGARIAEIAQLKLSDIVHEHGIWCISIRKSVDVDLVASENMKTRQTIKGRSSIRTIPIAQPILDAGFLDYVEEVRATKHPRLFPHLPGGTSRKTGEPNGFGYGTALSAQFGRHLKQHHEFPKYLAFHAFRHTFITGLEAQDVDVELIATITGHLLARRVPVLEKFYLKANPGTLRAKQAAAIALFHPPVVLPVYQRGQFAALLGPDAKMHP